MYVSIKRYFVHMLGTLMVLILIGAGVIWSMNGSVRYKDHPLLMAVDGEGPYVFRNGQDSLEVAYIHGDRYEGFTVQRNYYDTKEEVLLECQFHRDGSSFSFPILESKDSIVSYYETTDPILVVSDIEGGYAAFRDFLIVHGVVNEQLEWTFGRGHLVLLGDFVDRGASVTQVLWFAYSLEQQAHENGGIVHFIIGNHELYNLQGKHTSASPKYYGIASILGKQHHELYDEQSFLGNWLTAKNSILKINDHLFVHGGIHPSIVQYTSDLDRLNLIARQHYRMAAYPKPDKSLEQLINSKKNGLAWYRGYFGAEYSEDDIDQVLKHFEASNIVVGHTIQSKVKKRFNGKVVAVDVMHPRDYEYTWPAPHSEGLLIAEGQMYRLLDNGEKQEI